MADELIDLLIAGATDVTIEKAAKRHRWVRILKVISTLAFFALIIVVVFITLRYS